MSKVKAKPEAPATVAKATHTPGPWKVSEADVRGVYTADCSLIVTCHTVSLPENERPDRIDVTAANARLIAASPDLLEACEAAKAILNAYIPPDNFDGHAARALIMVRDAIKKARGE